LRFVIEDNLVY